MTIRAVVKHQNCPSSFSSFFLKEVYAHPPAAAACRQVLPRLSGVSIWKPADRTESLHIMLNLRPEGGSAGRRREARQHTAAAAATEEERGRKRRSWERKTGVSATCGGKQEVRWECDAGRACTGKHINVWDTQTERELRRRPNVTQIRFI